MYVIKTRHVSLVKTTVINAGKDNKNSRENALLRGKHASKETDNYGKAHRELTK